MRRTALLGLALLATTALAAPEAEYASQWSIAAPDDGAGAYRIMLDETVYREARSPALRDVDVLDGAGAAVPAQLFAPETAPALPPRHVPLRWFVLPASAGASGDDFSMRVERGADGRVLRVEAQNASPSAGGGRVAGGWLVDASELREPIEALVFEWEPGADFDRGYRIEASDDLRDWRRLPVPAKLVDLSRDGERLQLKRVPVQAQAKYLRLLPGTGAGTVPLRAVQAELASAATAPAPQWRTLDARVVEERGGTHYEFTLDGRFPIESADVQVDGNSTAEWTLYSREDADAPWRLRAGPWISYRIGSGDDGQRSQPQPVGRGIRDREWKLVPRTPSAQAPRLRLGWRPETLVFVAQGTPPYRLVAGSARAARGDAPVAQSLDAIRRVRGDGWQPPVATAGAIQPLAGERALRPAPAQRDWRTWLLWALLAGGALLVAGFAVSLLRKPAP